MIRRIIGYFIDANLLILLAVGDEDPHLISRHSRLDDYTASDYNILLDFLRQGRRVLVRACAKSFRYPFPLILSLSKDAGCCQRMVRQAHHEEMKTDFAQALCSGNSKLADRGVQPARTTWRTTTVPLSPQASSHYPAE